MGEDADRLAGPDVLVDQQARPGVLDDLVPVDPHARFVEGEAGKVHAGGVGRFEHGAHHAIDAVLVELAKGCGSPARAAHHLVGVLAGWRGVAHAEVSSRLTASDTTTREAEGTIIGASPPAPRGRLSRSTASNRKFASEPLEPSRQRQSANRIAGAEVRRWVGDPSPAADSTPEKRFAGECERGCDETDSRSDAGGIPIMDQPRSPVIQGPFRIQVPAGTADLREHPARRSHLHRHRLRGTPVPGERADRLRPVEPQGAVRRGDPARLVARRRALHGRAPAGERPPQLVLCRQPDARCGEQGAGRLHADLPVAGARPVRPPLHRHRRRAHPDLAAGSAWLPEPGRQRRYREGCRQVGLARGRPDQPAHASRAGRRLPARGRGRLPGSSRRAAARVRPGRARTRSPPGSASTSARIVQDGDTIEVGYGSDPQRHHVRARTEEAPRGPHRAADRRHRRSHPARRGRQLAQDPQPRQDRGVLLHGEARDLRVHRRQPRDRAADHRLHEQPARDRAPRRT